MVGCLTDWSGWDGSAQWENRFRKFASCVVDVGVSVGFACFLSSQSRTFARSHQRSQTTRKKAPRNSQWLPERNTRRQLDARMRSWGRPEAKIWPKLPLIGLSFWLISSTWQQIIKIVSAQIDHWRIELYFGVKIRRQIGCVLLHFACELRRCMFEILFDSN